MTGGRVGGAALAACAALATLVPAAEATDYAIASLAGAQLTVLEREPATPEPRWSRRVVALPDPVLDMAALEAADRALRAARPGNQVLYVELDREGAARIAEADTQAAELAALRASVAKTVKSARSERLVLVLPATAPLALPGTAPASGLGTWGAIASGSAAVPDTADGLFVHVRVEVVDAVSGALLGADTVSADAAYPAGEAEQGAMTRGTGSAPIVRALGARLSREIERVVPSLLARVGD